MTVERSRRMIAGGFVIASVLLGICRNTSRCSSFVSGTIGCGIFGTHRRFSAKPLAGIRSGTRIPAIWPCDR